MKNVSVDVDQYLLISSAHVKIHFVAIRDLWSRNICHKPMEMNSLLLYDLS